MVFRIDSVGTTETKLLSYDPVRTSWVVKNNSGANILYLCSRGQGTNGFPIGAGGTMSAKIPEDNPTEEVWAIASGAATDVRIYEGYGLAAK